MFKWRQNSPNTGFASWSRIDTTCLNALCHCCARKVWAASAQSFTLWQQATIEITFVVTISKYYQLLTSFTSIIRGHSKRSLHREHSIIACSRYIYMGVILRTHRTHPVNRTFNAMPTERLQHHFEPCHAYKQKVGHILQAWRIVLPKYFSEPIALKSKLKFCHTVPSPQGGLWWA